MNRMTVKKQRKVLRGWIKWVPVVVIPFSILFFHTWLNIQILRADYTLRELDAEAREWSDRLNHTGVAETIHEDPNMLADQAAQLAFVQPSPGQREIIYYDPAVPLILPEDKLLPEEKSLTVAQADILAHPASVTGGATPVVQPTPEAVASPAAPQAEIPVAPAPVSSLAEPAPAANAVVNPTPVPVPLAPVAAEPEVVLDLPEDAYLDELEAMESAMESLESL